MSLFQSNINQAQQLIEATKERNRSLAQQAAASARTPREAQTVQAGALIGSALGQGLVRKLGWDEEYNRAVAADEAAAAQRAQMQEVMGAFDFNDPNAYADNLIRSGQLLLQNATTPEEFTLALTTAQQGMDIKRAEEEKIAEQQQLQLEAQSREEYVSLMRHQGYDEDLVQAVSNGTLTAKEAAAELRLRGKAANDALKPETIVVNGQPKRVLLDVSTGNFTVIGDALDTRPTTNMQITTQSIAPPPKDYEYEYDTEGRVVSMRVIPGSKTAREIEKEEREGELQQKSTARQLNPTIDDIRIARRLGEEYTLGFIPRTGMFAPLVKSLPFIGQPNVDLDQTLAAIESGISLENLNQMRRAGGTLGAVSNFQSELLASAFGDLKSSKSRELFLYNLARVENTLNDIVHGEGKGPERHDMDKLDRVLRGLEPSMQEDSGIPPVQDRIQRYLTD